MNKPHKHAELIKQWADGAEIEFSHGGSEWVENDDPTWYEDTEYRVKPQPLEGWTVIYKSGALSEILSLTEVEAIERLNDDNDVIDRVVHLREVTKDERSK